jgi:hypothetical protein
VKVGAKNFGLEPIILPKSLAFIPWVELRREDFVGRDDCAKNVGDTLPGKFRKSVPAEV